MVRCDRNRRIGFGDTVVHATALAEVVRVGISTVKAPRIARIVPSVGRSTATEVQEAAQVTLAPSRRACSSVRSTVVGHAVWRDAARRVSLVDLISDIAAG